jgi:hypothetical protein
MRLELNNFGIHILTNRPSDRFDTETTTLIQPTDIRQFCTELADVVSECPLVFHAFPSKVATVNSGHPTDICELKNLVHYEWQS